MVEILISLTPSVRDIRGVFYLLSLGKVVRPVSASVLQLVSEMLHSLTLLIYLAYYGFHHLSSPHLVIPIWGWCSEDLTIIGCCGEPVKLCIR